VLRDVHDGNARDLSDAALEIAIARRNNIALVLPYALNQTVICIRAGVCAREALKTAILDNPADNKAVIKKRKRTLIVQAHRTAQYLRATRNLEPSFSSSATTLHTDKRSPNESQFRELEVKAKQASDKETLQTN